ncbi:hypothetical protein Theco_4090 (plasmid) [Thermobacillus composti KWC4]|jgi:hypothetical protein|uniref:Uncharacterized protein n=1 Tax=Thermobacillus composti (strain DSM 18247 / JCM 13945 / KWC4) TaxID=717605 RepID=L0EK69_THECK|nr:hypothetical protein [Thermobacillus composti]AGA60089.1 hypothetical protein Theco_4090 [Thermobacillus composti KWC4]
MKRTALAEKNRLAAERMYAVERAVEELKLMSSTAPSVDKVEEMSRSVKEALDSFIEAYKDFHKSFVRRKRKEGLNRGE